MVSPPKKCKYGCGTMIEWDAAQHQFNTQGTTSRHDCRDWDKSKFPPATEVDTQQPYTQAPPNGETLIALQAKKTWENYFKLLEPMLANLAAIASSSEETNKQLIELGNKLRSLEDTMTVQRVKTTNGKKQEVVENGA